MLDDPTWSEIMTSNSPYYANINADHITPPSPCFCTPELCFHQEDKCPLVERSMPFSKNIDQNIYLLEHPKIFYELFTLGGKDFHGTPSATLAPNTYSYSVMDRKFLIRNGKATPSVLGTTFKEVSMIANAFDHAVSLEFFFSLCGYLPFVITISGLCTASFYIDPKSYIRKLIETLDQPILLSIDSTTFKLPPSQSINAACKWSKEAQLQYDIIDGTKGEVTFNCFAVLMKYQTASSLSPHRLIPYIAQIIYYAMRETLLTPNSESLTQFQIKALPAITIMSPKCDGICNFDIVMEKFTTLTGDSINASKFYGLETYIEEFHNAPWVHRTYHNSYHGHMPCPTCNHNRTRSQAEKNEKIFDPHARRWFSRYYISPKNETYTLETLSFVLAKSLSSYGHVLVSGIPAMWNLDLTSLRRYAVPSCSALMGIPCYKAGCTFDVEYVKVVSVRSEDSLWVMNLETSDTPNGPPTNITLLTALRNSFTVLSRLREFHMFDRESLMHFDTISQVITSQSANKLGQYLNYISCSGNSIAREFVSLPSYKTRFEFLSRIVSEYYDEIEQMIKVPVYT
jgi:hypothetical protein